MTSRHGKPNRKGALGSRKRAEVHASSPPSDTPATIGSERSRHRKILAPCDQEPPLRLVGTIRGANQRKTAEQKLQESEALLTQAEQLTNMGNWQYTVKTKDLLWSAQFCRMLGFEPGHDPIPFAQACGLLHPDDGPRVWRDAEALVAGQPLVENEARFILADGRVRIFHSRAVSVANEEGRVVCIRGVSRDVTDQRNEEDRLRKSEALLAQAEQIANVGSWDIDIATRKLIWSEQLYNLLGVCPWQGANEQLYWSNLHPDDRIRVRQITDRAVQDCKEFSYLARYRLPTGRWRVHHTRGVPIPGADGKTAHMIGVVQDITEQTQVEEELHRLSREVMRARDEERRHMARELHESAGQSLAALKMTLGNLREALPKRNSLAKSLLQSCVDLTNESVREVRTISYLMHPPMLDEAGLPSALRWYAKGFSERSKIQVEVDVPDDFGRQPQEIEMTVFRIVQEALTNVHRYSGSKIARIRLAQDSEGIRAEVQDEGCGLAHPTQSNGTNRLSGVGIAGMRERVHQLKGTFEIDSAPGRGTAVRVTLPTLPPRSGTVDVKSEETDGERRDANLHWVRRALSLRQQGGSHQ